LPEVSVTLLTVALVSFQPTTTTFKFPAVWAATYFTLWVETGDCGVAYESWMNWMPPPRAWVIRPSPLLLVLRVSPSCGGALWVQASPPARSALARRGRNEDVRLRREGSQVLSAFMCAPPGKVAPSCGDRAQTPRCAAGVIVPECRRRCDGNDHRVGEDHGSKPTR
jgi:hypothetical protein